MRIKVLFGVLRDSCCSVPQSLRPRGLQHTRLPCPSLSLRVCSNSCPLSRWCHPTISLSMYCSLLLPWVFPSFRIFSNELWNMFIWLSCLVAREKRLIKCLIFLTILNYVNDLLATLTFCHFFFLKSICKYFLPFLFFHLVYGSLCCAEALKFK